MMDQLKKYYKNFGLTQIKDKKWLKNQELYNLFKKPLKDNKINTPHFNQTFSKDVDHQADLIFLPNDNGYKYALVITDIATRLSDAEPLKTKNSSEVLKAFKKIYNRNILSIPEFIYTDAGSEFKGTVKKYFENNNVEVKYAKPGRHRQMSVVERTNQYLGKIIFMRMQAQEILTGEPSYEWIEDLPKYIKAINKRRKIIPNKPTDDVLCSGDSCNILDIGTKVRAVLDTPTDYLTEKRLHGKFRVSDIKWNPEIKIIKDILLLPGRPPLYLLNQSKNISKIDNSVAYTKNQLQIVPKHEQAPDPIVIRGNPTSYVVQKIVDKKKINNKIYYKVRWKGYKSNQDTWEKRTQLMEDIPLLVNEYENNN